MYEFPAGPDLLNRTPQMVGLSGNIPGQVGSYDLCLRDLTGTKFCLALSDAVQSRRLMGLCLPESCNQSDVFRYLAALVSNTTFPADAVGCGLHESPAIGCNSTTTRLYCSNAPNELGWFGILAIVLFFVILLVVVTATLIDYFKSITNPPPVTPSGSPTMSQYQSIGDGDSGVTRRLPAPHSDGEGTQGSGSARGPGRPQLDTSLLHVSASGSYNGVGGGAKRPPLTRFQRIVVAFSLIASFKRWRQYTKDEPTNVFNSVRVLCLLWVCVTDVFFYTSKIPSYTHDLNEETNVLYSLIQRRTAATFGIGTFLFISGFTAAQTLFADYRRRRRDVDELLAQAGEQKCTQRYGFDKIGWYVRYVLQRWVRLVPLYATVIVLAHATMAPLGSGPFWATFVESPEMSVNCGKNWFTNVLFFNNLYPKSDQQCFSWSYYFALDFQYFLIAPLIVWLYRNVSLRIFTVLTSVVAASSLVARGFTYYDAVVHEAQQAVVNPKAAFNSAYAFPDASLPWSMFVPFLGGTLLYIFYYEMMERDKEEKMFVHPDMKMGVQQTAVDKLSQWTLTRMKRKRVRIVSIWGGVLMGVANIVAYWVIETKRATGLLTRTQIAGLSVYGSLSLLLWFVSSVMILLPMLLGFGGTLRRFLCHRLWCGISRLVFAGYLLHPIIIILYNATRVSPAVMGFMPFLYEVCGDMVVTLVVAFYFHLAIEQPMIQLTSSSSSSTDPQSPPAREI